MEPFTIILTVISVGMLIAAKWNPDKGSRLSYLLFIISAISTAQVLIDPELSGFAFTVPLVLNLGIFLFNLATMAGELGRKEW